MDLKQYVQFELFKLVQRRFEAKKMRTKKIQIDAINLYVVVKENENFDHHWFGRFYP